MEGEDELLHAWHRGLDIVMPQYHKQNADAFGDIQICDSFGWDRSLVHAYDFTRTRRWAPPGPGPLRASDSPYACWPLNQSSQYSPEEFCLPPIGYSDRL